MTGVRHKQLATGIHAVIIDRPDKRNVCDLPTWESLANALVDVALNPDIRVLVFTGANGISAQATTSSPLRKLPPTSS
jgi:enoyl-CoA hydratase/carnithine racemase